MRLQVSLDRTDTKSALGFMKDIYDVVDIVEIGTPFIIKEGVHAVKAMRERYPGITILADCKIMDGGEYASSLAFEAGADIVTVLSVAEDNTIKGVIKSAQKYNKQVLVDLIASPSPLQRAKQIDELRVDYIGVHTGFDMQAQGNRPVEALKQLIPVLRHAKAAVAGGVDLETLPQIVESRPEIVIVGKSITQSPNPRETILKMKKFLQD